jgi:peptide-methionine (S)-S-oxide reductase
MIRTEVRSADGDSHLGHVFRKLPGVLSTRVGYTGGDVPDATYRNHHGHAEAIEITFDPGRISYRDLLEFFFQIHDPTTRNRQGNDIGTSYRSAIFYLSDAQKQTAEDTIADVDASGLWPGKVVTEVSPAGPFWEAEPAYSAKGLSTWTPASSKSLTLRVTTVMPCTRAVAAMSASITGRGCAYC